MLVQATGGGAGPGWLRGFVLWVGLKTNEWKVSVQCGAWLEPLEGRRYQDACETPLCSYPGGSWT